MNALVSVIIPAYNAEKTLERALESVLAQTYEPLDVIVVDDGSSDATAEIVDNYEPKGIRLIRLPENRGVSGARNAGIEAAQGDYVAFLDADDEWLTEKTAKQMDVISHAPEMSLIACHAEFVSSAPGAPKRVHDGRTVVTGAEAWKALLAYPFIATPCVLARRRHLVACGMFDPDLVVAEDQDMWIRLARAGGVGYVDQVLVRVYDEPESLTKNFGSENISNPLDLVRAYLRNWHTDLTRRDRRQILGHRYTSLGRNLYVNGSTWPGITSILKAATLGNSIVENFTYLILAAPPMRWLKLKLHHHRYSSS